jgi:hypothetical protein
VSERIALDGVEEAFGRMHRGEVLRSSVVLGATPAEQLRHSAGTTAVTDVAFAGRA